jgi:hypothetical protein
LWVLGEPIAGQPGNNMVVGENPAIAETNELLPTHFLIAPVTKDKQAREIPLPQRLVLMLERIEPKKGRVFDTTNIRKEWR